MKIEKFVVGPVGTNCYIVQNEEKKSVFSWIRALVRRK